MKNAKKIPLSQFASCELSNNFWFSFLAFPILLVLVLGLVAALIMSVIFAIHRFPSDIFALYMIWTLCAIWIITSLVGFTRWKKDKKKIIQENALDYARSLALKSVLKAYPDPELNKYPILGEEYQAQWKPFRVEHYVSNFLRAEMSGRISICGGLFAKTGSSSGNIGGMAIPNLLDHSSVIFLKNDRNTLRVLIPSPRAVKELFMRTLEYWLRELPKDSHAYGVLNEFSMETENFVNQLSHPQIIDSLNAACELPFESRPEVIVRGEKIQDGIVLATSLQTDGKDAIFLPSGFFREFVGKMQPFIETAKEPLPIEALIEK